MAKVMGLKELQKRMHALSGPVAGDIARKAVASAASFVKKQAKLLAEPIAEDAYIASGGEKDFKVGKVKVSPGNVPRNIIIKRIKNTELSAHYIVTIRGKKKYGYAKRIGALMEYGTVNQAARPFLGPALGNNLKKVKDIVARRIQSGLKKEGAL